MLGNAYIPGHARGPPYRRVDLDIHSRYRKGICVLLDPEDTTLLLFMFLSCHVLLSRCYVVHCSCYFFFFVSVGFFLVGL